MEQPILNLFGYVKNNDEHFSRKARIAIMKFLCLIDEHHCFKNLKDNINLVYIYELLDDFDMIGDTKNYFSEIYIFCKLYIEDKEIYLYNSYYVEDIYPIYNELCENGKISPLSKTEKKNFCTNVLQNLKKNFNVETGINLNLIRSTMLNLYNDLYNTKVKLSK